MVGSTRGSAGGSRSLGSVARAALAVGIAAGIALGVGLATWVALLNGWQSGRDPVLLALHLSGLYTLASLVVVAAAAALLGLAVAQDMDGAPLPIARAGGRLDRAPAVAVSYGPAAPAQGAESTDADALKQHEEYLRALGYVN